MFCVLADNRPGELDTKPQQSNRRPGGGKVAFRKRSDSVEEDSERESAK